MKRRKSLILSASLILFLVGTVMAQTDTASHTVTMNINEIAVLNLIGGNITMTVEAPGNGGETPANPADSNCYLQYTSTVADTLTRTIEVAWGGSDAAPAGCSLLVTATPGAGEGTASAQRTISSTGQTVVTAIGSCATGTGGADGAQLAYVLSVNDVSSLLSDGDKTATITYTLTDDA
jgi:hypothetical protein